MRNKKKAIIMALIMFCFHLTIFAQNISLSKNNITVKNAMEALKKEYGYSFVFESGDVNTQKIISLSAKNQSVDGVVEQILQGQDVSYEIKDKNIIVKKGTVKEISDSLKKVITGTVSDSYDMPVIGANIKEIGTSNGTTSDIDGHFSLTVSSNATIEVSFIGYMTQQLSIGNHTNIFISLEEDTRLLNEVVVVGYGIQRKGDLTSSISSVKSESFNKGAVQDAAQLLQGKVAGLGVVLTTGNPTSTTQIMLRGVGTLRSSSSPLIVVDGVPGDLTTVATEDIESIDVVKDGSAAAIYGTRGSNGVIFITTKKARGVMTPTIEIHSYITTQQIKKKLDMMNADQYRELVKQGKPGAIDYGYDTEWLDLLLRTPISSISNVSIRGGTAQTNYVANINYKEGQGIVKRSDNNVFTTRLEINHSMWENLLKFNINLMGREQSFTTLADGSSFRGDIYRNAFVNIPTDRPKDDDGNWVEHTAMNNYMNSQAALYESDGKNKSTQLKTFGSITLTPIDKWFIKLLVSNTAYKQTRGYMETKKHISTIKDKKNGFASRGTTSEDEKLLELTSQYKNNFNRHEITGLIGYSYQDYVREHYWMQNWDFPSDEYTYNNMGAGAALKRGEAKESSFKEKTMLIGFFARLNYNYKDKYLATASIRHEGSTKFGVNHKWGNFPAFSVGWNAHNESFMKDFSFISNFKFRVGFGITGTVPSDPYVSISQLTTGSNFWTGESWVPTLRPSSNANPDLKWEKKEEWNYGFDFGFLKQRVGGSIDLYKRKTTDMLWAYQVAMPPFLFDNIIANAGTMENSGLEIQLFYTPLQTKDYTWTSTINYSTNKNKLISLSNDKFQLKSGFIDEGATGEPIQQKTHRMFEGGEVGNFWGYKTIDIDENGRWIIESKDGNPKPIAGQQEDDKKIIGNGLPKHLLSWNNSLTYKNFDLTITMRGAFGYDILNMPRLFYEVPVSLTRGNVMADTYKPKYGKTVLNDNQELQYVSYYIEKGDFWKIDNITLGYNINLNNKYIKQVRVYTTGTNLFTITGYSGVDPEVNISSLAPGCDPRDAYPSTRTFTFGAMFTF